MTKCIKGGHSSRVAVEVALNNAIKKAKETAENYGSNEILQIYNELYESKLEPEYDEDGNKIPPPQNIVPMIFNSKAPISASFSYIWKKRKDIPWGEHFHATFIVEVNGEYIEFSHAVQYIFISKHPRPMNTLTQMVTCAVLEGETNKTLGDLVKMALYHWYAVNQVKSVFQWPTSCTGFTDFLMYYTYYQNFDILSKCPLTIQRKAKGYKSQVHHIYQDPMIPVDAGKTTVVRKSMKRPRDESSDDDIPLRHLHAQPPVNRFSRSKKKSPKRKSRHRRSVRRKSRRKSPKRKSRRKSPKRKSRHRRSVRRKSRRKSPKRKSRHRRSVRRKSRRKSPKRKSRRKSPKRKSRRKSPKRKSMYKVV